MNKQWMNSYSMFEFFPMKNTPQRMHCKCPTVFCVLKDFSPQDHINSYIHGAE